MIREIVYETEGKRKLAQGIKMLCKILLQEGRILVNGSYTYSAHTVAKEIEGEDLWKNQGIRLAADMIAELNAKTGCTTAMAARVTLAMLKECERLHAGGMNPVRLARELNRASVELADYIKQQSRDNSRPMEELLWDVVQDEKVKLVAKALEVGEVVVKESMGLQTQLEIIKGISMEAPLICGSPVTKNGIYVLITDGVIETFQTLLPVLESLHGSPLLIVAEDIRGEALTLLQTNVKNGILAVWAVKAPGIGRRKEDFLGDLAALTNTVVCKEPELIGINLQTEQLGWAEQVQMTAKRCVVSGNGDKSVLQTRIAQIQKKIEAMDTNYYDQQQLRSRIAALSGTMAVLRVGGETQVQVKEEKLRLEYAVAYGQTITEHGMFAMEQLKEIPVETTGMQVLMKSVKAGFSEDEVSAWLLELIVRKVSGMIRMWLTTGAVMVSTAYDREDLELMKSGVNVNQLRGSV